MSAMSYVILGIALAVPGVLLVRERRYGQVLDGAGCLAVDGRVRINGLLH